LLTDLVVSYNATNQGANNKPMQIAQYQKDQILEFETTIGTFIKKRIKVFWPLVHIVGIVEIVVSSHN
jgi:hypothetical protein